MKSSPAILAVLLLAAPARSQVVEGDVITAHDRKGNIYTVYNTVEGRTGSVRILRLSAEGTVLWSLRRPSMDFERIYAAAMDSKGDLYLAGVRRHEARKRILLLKYRSTGRLLWEAVDARHECTALEIVVDDDDSPTLAGVCRAEGTHPARLLKFGRNGSALWQTEFDGGGRNYVRDLNSLRGDIALTVETVAGAFREASNTIQVLVYNKAGQKVTP